MRYVHGNYSWRDMKLKMKRLRDLFILDETVPEEIRAWLIEAKRKERIQSIFKT